MKKLASKALKKASDLIVSGAVPVNTAEKMQLSGMTLLTAAAKFPIKSTQRRKLIQAARKRGRHTSEKMKIR